MGFRFLRERPLPEAKVKLIHLEKIGLKSDKRAKTFFPDPLPAILDQLRLPVAGLIAKSDQLHVNLACACYIG